MKSLKKNRILIGIGLLILFVLWTVAVSFVDRGQIGPEGTWVGFSALNAFVRDSVGVNMALYEITDWLGIVPILTAFCFAVLGDVQLIRRKSLVRVDKSILALGIFYFAVIAVYLAFEVLPLNYRPLLIEGRLEASYPSSTTLLTLAVMPTALMQIRARAKSLALSRFATVAIIAFTAFVVIARVLSGVHWITDIIGGLLVSLGLVALYSAVEI